MRYRVRIDPVALSQIEEFAAYLRNYSEDFATEQIERLDRIIASNLAELAADLGSLRAHRSALSRLLCSALGAAPNIGSSTRSTKRRRTVNILHFWNAMRDPESLEL